MTNENIHKWKEDLVRSIQSHLVGQLILMVYPPVLTSTVVPTSPTKRTDLIILSRSTDGTISTRRSLQLIKVDNQFPLYILQHILQMILYLERRVPNLMLVTLSPDNILESANALFLGMNKSLYLSDISMTCAGTLVVFYILRITPSGIV